MPSSMDCNGKMLHANAPELLRSSTAGRGLGAAFTFKTFTVNLLGLWSWALRTQGREGAIMVTKGLWGP